MKIKHFVFLFIVLFALSCSHHQKTEVSTPINSSTHRVLLVFAHPDDETIMGSMLIYLQEHQIPVRAIYATNGSGGKHLSKPGITPEEMGKVREFELVQATKCYGFEHKIVGLKDAPFRDANGTPIRDADIFLKSNAWDATILRKAIEDEVANFNPDILITMGLDKNSHAHHQSVRIITEKLLNEKNLKSIQYAFGMGNSESQDRIGVSSNRLADLANKCAHFHQSQSVGHSSPFYGREELSLFYSTATLPDNFLGLSVVRNKI